MYIVFDTETTGLPDNWNARYTDVVNWPRMVQLAWQEYDANGNLLKEFDLIIKPDNYIIPDEAIKVHRITNEIANEKGIPLKEALEIFGEAIDRNEVLVAHNIDFDINVTACEFYRMGMPIRVFDCNHVDTVNKETTLFVGIMYKGRLKFPTLTELYKKIFNTHFEEAHNALADVKALADCFFVLLEKEIMGRHQPSGESAKDVLNGMFSKVQSSGEDSSDRPFVHLNNHTFHSILEGAMSVKDLVDAAKSKGHPAVAITDVSTMSGTFELFQKSGDVKAIHGVEFYVNDKILTIEDPRAQGDPYKLRMYAKNEKGYKNMCRLLYLANTEGFHKFGRICPEWLEKYSSDVIVTTGSLEGKIAEHLNVGKVGKAKTYFEWLITTFGKDNVYAEFQLTPESQQKIYNTFLVKMVQEFKIKSIITGNNYFVNKDDWKLQHIVSAMKQKIPLDKARLKENSECYFYGREDFYRANEEFGYNYPKEFIDRCLDRTLEVADRCNFEFETGVEKYPEYEITDEVEKWVGSRDTETVIRKIATAKLKVKLKKNAELGYIEINDEKFKEYIDRLEFEIGVIRDKKMLDYFLVCWELVRDYESQEYEGKKLAIGPGRGSAGGSLLAWAMDLIKVDPLRFDLYFERFLNPSRNSPPDLDLDFLTGTDHISDKFLYDKYGEERVMSVGTFSTFNEKGCLKDVARAIIGQEATASGSVVWRVTDAMPDFGKEKISLSDWFRDFPNDPNCPADVKHFLLNEKEVLGYTVRLQGQIKGIGQHAAGVVITPGPSWEYIPTNVIPKGKGEPPAIVTAFQEADGSGKDLSAVGILKLDRLKLETINVVEETIALIKETKGLDLRDQLYHLDLSDPNLFEEVRLGLNHGVFQFESAGMGSLIKSMKVETFEELVACNALYRPGPMGIGAHEEFVRNKFNPKGIKYIHSSLEPILSKTNGVLVFQEQLMFIAHEIGGMSLGDGDYLRRFMGNSGDLIQKDLQGLTLTKEEEENYNYQNFKKYWGMFVDGAKNQGYSDQEVDSLKAYLLKYLGYSFNRSHSLCYSYVACQTLFLKHYYPTEFYAVLLNHSKGKNPQELRERVSATISTALSKGIKISPPTRKSAWNWKVTGENEITMGFSAIKGFGDVAYEELVENLGKKGKTFPEVSKFTFFDTVYSKFNKSAFEALVKAGVFDDWSHSRVELLDLFLKANKAKKKRKIDVDQLNMFGASYESELKADEINYAPTGELEKRKDFEEVCNCDLFYIERATEIKSIIKEKYNLDLPSIMDYVKSGGHYFIVQDKIMKKTKTGKDFLNLHVSDGISTTKINIFGGDVKKIDPKLERGGVYISYFNKNERGFMNFSKVIPMSERGKARPKKEIILKHVITI